MSAIPFDLYTKLVQQAIRQTHALTLASLLALDNADRVIQGLQGSHPNTLLPHTRHLTSPFPELLIAHIQVLVLYRQATQDGSSYLPAYKQQVICLNLFMNQFLIHQSSWPLPVLYQLCRDLRELGERADDYLISSGQQKTPLSLEDTARHINKAFTIVATDRFAFIILSFQKK